jgi:aryl-alcohol dehydrogenase-like predicted oxidoreductase
VRRKESLAALGAAHEAGITFYDTAWSYGCGESEALLGEFSADAQRVGGGVDEVWDTAGTD